MEGGISSLGALPFELLRLIVLSCENLRDVAALSASNHRYHDIVGRLLYEMQVDSQNWHVVFWAAKNGRVGTLRRWTSVRKPLGANPAGLDVYMFRQTGNASPFIHGPLHGTVQRQYSHLWGPIHQAAMHGHKDAVEYLLDNGADIDAPSVCASTAGLGIFKDARDRSNYWAPECVTLSPLHLSIITGQIEVARFLLDRNADLNVMRLHISQPSGITALHLAAAYGLLPIVRMIGQRPGVNLDALDMDGQSPMLYAAQNEVGHASFEVLKALGANLDAVVHDRRGSPHSLLVDMIRGIKWRAAVKLIDLGASLAVEEGQPTLLQECEKAQMSVIHPDIPDMEAWGDLVTRLGVTPSDQPTPMGRLRMLWRLGRRRRSYVSGR
jgi:hypothetical protein